MELKPCPFCKVESTDEGFIAHTDDCYLMRKYMGETRRKQAEAWNTRPIEDALQSKITMLENELATLRAANQWHPASEPPTNERFVIGASTNGTRYYVWFSGGSWRWEKGQIIRFIDVWHELP